MPTWEAWSTLKLMCILRGEFVSQLYWTDRHVEDHARAASPTGTIAYL